MKTFADFFKKEFLLICGLVLINISGVLKPDNGVSFALFLLLIITFTATSMLAEWFFSENFKSSLKNSPLIVPDKDITEDFLSYKNDFMEFWRWNHNKTTNNAAKLKLLLMKIRLSMISQNRDILHPEILDEIEHTLNKNP